jgi:tRNA 2-thiouridine synthesizing protein A
MDADLDLCGLKCPLPVLKTRKALEGVAPGARLRVVCTDALAAIDIPHLVRETGDVLEHQENGEGRLIFVIRKAESA